MAGATGAGAAPADPHAATTPYNNAYPGWEQQYITAIGGPVGSRASVDVQFLDQWHGFELSRATNNPLNLTQPEPGSFSINSAGVQSYPTTSASVAAWQATIAPTGGTDYYPNLRAALKRGYDFTSPSIGSELRTWGSVNFASNLQKTGVTGGSQGPGAILSSTGQTIVHGIGDTLTGWVKQLWDAVLGLIVPVLEVLAGGALILLGLYLLAKQIGVSVPTPPALPG